MDISKPQGDLIDLHDCVQVHCHGDPFVDVPPVHLQATPQHPSPFDSAPIEALVKKWADRCKTIKPMLYSLGEVLPTDNKSKWIDVMNSHKHLDDPIVLKKVYWKALLLTHPDKQKKDPEHLARAEVISRYLTDAYKGKQS
jgi:hypothetical protein